jgi:hypothetical protein
MRHQLIITTVVLLAATLFGCAGTPDVGVRKPFRDARVDAITVVDFYATSTFGLSDDEFDARMLTYEAAALEWLEASGIEVHAPEALRQRLEERSLQQTFTDGVVLERPLDELFEPGDDQAPLESQTVKSIAAQGGFPSPALFFAEVVYQTVGTCEGKVNDYNPRAVVLEPIGDAAPPTNCVVSHLDAKLVDAASGATMWQNRLLVEQWYPSESDVERIIDATIVTVVRLTLEGSGGIAPLLGGS